MSASNWRAPAEKPSGSPSVHGTPSRTSSGAGLQQVAPRARGEVGTARDPDAARGRVHARAPLVPRRVEGDGHARDPARAHLAERLAGLEHEEAARERLAD